MFAILIFIIILSVLVMIHELGHFLMAKRAGIGVDEFGFGLPPRLWGKKIGETIYSVNWLPFGGFVRLVGEDPTDRRRNEKNSFYHKSLFERTTVIVAGVFMNFALAIAIFYVVVFALGSKVSLPLYIDHKFSFVNETRQVLVSDVTPGSPADKAGIKLGESIVAVEGTEIGSVSALQQIVRASADRNIKITLENPVNNQRRDVVAVPTLNQQTQNVALGVNLGELAVLNYQTFPQKLFAGFIHSYNTVDYSIRVMADLIGFSVKTGDYRAVSEGVSGPVGIASIFQQAVALGPISVLQLAGLLSLNLAVLNILPFPALDGGRFFFIIIETVTRRRIHATFERWAHTIGFAILIGLIILITYNDILKLINKQLPF